MNSEFFRSRLRSFGFAIAGIAALIRTQANARIHLAATVTVTTMAIWLDLTAPEWAILTLTIGLVWTAEAMNTAIEILADTVHPERSPLIGTLKDIAAGGVLVAAIASVAVAIALFLPKFR